MRILLPVDGSEHSSITIQELLRRPWPDGTQVEVLSVAVADPDATHSAHSGKTLHSEALEKERVRARRDVDAAAAKITQSAPALEIFTRTMEGSPTDGILREAKEWGANLIIMGSHGQNAALRIILGSVAHAVAQNAPCSVEVVRKPQEEAAHAA